MSPVEHVGDAHLLICLFRRLRRQTVLINFQIVFRELVSSDWLVSVHIDAIGLHSQLVSYLLNSAFAGGRCHLGLGPLLLDNFLPLLVQLSLLFILRQFSNQLSDLLIHLQNFLILFLNLIIF